MAYLPIMACKVRPIIIKIRLKKSFLDAIELMDKVRKARASGFRCGNCRAPSCDTDLWACITCYGITEENPEAALTICANCVLKSHEHHIVKSLTDFRQTLYFKKFNFLIF